MKKIGIIGLGLIGTSLGLALKKYNDVIIQGYDIKSEHLHYTLQENIVDKVLENENIEQMDIIFIAVPVCSIIPVIKKIFPYINYKKTIITDMGSTKEYLIKEISRKFPRLKFIGGHPMAGKEKSGPKAASADLFKNKSYILTDDNINIRNDEIKEIKNLLTSIGCRVNIMNSTAHDRMVAMTSHLPQITASALIDQLKDNEEKNPDISELIGTGFLDLTRIAASSPQMWLDIFSTNKKNIINQINELIAKLNDFKQNIEEENIDRLNQVMVETKKKRINLESNFKKGEKNETKN
ncbi:MAG: prephenate dehydrogenase [Bacillota bacterium]